MPELTWKPDPWMLALCLGLLLLAWGLMALLIAGKREEDQREASRCASDALTSELIEEDKGNE